ncbi:hypothetical protein R84B8_03143 [Treponema sp. R8-4-B8]
MMELTIQQTLKLLKQPSKFNLLAFSMFLTQQQTIFFKKPSEEMLKKCTEEINKFLKRYHRLMTKDHAILVQFYGAAMVQSFAVMEVSVSQTEKLLKGDFKFDLLAFSMFLTRLKEIYAKNPSRQTLESCNIAMNEFFKKAKQLMVADYAKIEKL